MTRKEKLVMEIAEVRYQLRTLKGQLAVSPEDYYNSRMYQLEVKNNKVYELEEQLKGLKESLEKAKLDTQIQQRTEAYYATEEGKAYKAERQQAVEEITNKWQALEDETIRTLDEQIKHRLGAHWGVGTLRDTYLEIGVCHPEIPGKFYFGQTAEIYCSLDIWKEKQRFEINVGTCGSTDLLGGSTLVVFLLTAGQGDEQLGVTVICNIELHTDYRQTLLLYGALQLVEFLAAQKKLAVTTRIMFSPTAPPVFHNLHI